MTGHELARKLLDLPDHEVACGLTSIVDETREIGRADLVSSD